MPAIDSSAGVHAASVHEPPVSADRSLASGTLISVGMQVGLITSTAVMSVVIARLFGPSGNGAYALLATLFLVGTAVFGIGLRSGITYVVSQGRWNPRTAFVQSQAVAFGLGAVGTLAGLGFYAVARDDILAGVTLPMAIVVMASLPFGLAWLFSSSVALGLDRYESYAALQLVQAGASVVIGVVLAVTVGLLGAVTGFAASQAAAALAGWVLLRRLPAAEVGRSVGAGAGALGEAARFGARAWGSEVLQFLNYRLDLFILSAFASTATVGRYSVAVSLTALGWLLPHGLQPVLFSRTSSLDAKVQRGQVSAHDSDRAVARACRHLVILLLPTAVVLALLLLFAVPVFYGSGFEATIGLGFILLPGVLAVGLAKVLSVVISGRGRPIYTLYVSGATAVATIALYAALIPSLRAPGAALGSTISYLTSCALCVALLRRTTGIEPRSALVPRRSDLADYRRALASLRARLRSLRDRGGRRPVRATSQ